MIEQFFIFGHYGRKNTGDDAMIYSLLQELSLLFPTTVFAIFSHIPVKVPSESRNSIKFVKPSIITVLLELMRSKIFIMGGGTHIYDYDHSSRFKRLIIMCKMFFLLLWANFFCEKIYFIGIGIEPFSTKWGKILSKKICNLSDFISLRDRSSFNIVNSMGFRDKSVLSFDLAALLPYSLKNSHDILINSRKEKILGISVLPFFEIYHNDKEKDCIFISEIAKGLNQWLKRDESSFIHLFIFKGQSKADDVEITYKLRKQLEPSERVRLINYTSSPVEMLHEVAKCNFFVGMRYHSCMFSYLTSKPLIIINYFEKCKALAEDIKLPEYAILSIEDILNGSFDECLQKLQNCPENFIAALPIDTAKLMSKKCFPRSW